MALREKLHYMASVVDDGFILVATRVAHAVQRMTGRSAFYLVWLSAMVILLSRFLTVANYWAKLPIWPPTPLFSVPIAVWVMVSIYPIARGYAEAERVFQEGTGAIPAEARLLLGADLLMMAYLRLAMTWAFGTVTLLMLWSVDVRGLLTDASPWFVALVYFGCVTPLPPGPSRIGEWLKAMRTRPLVPIRVGNR